MPSIFRKRLRQATLISAVFASLLTASHTMAADSIVGMKVDDFELVDHTGAAQRLYYYDNASAIVLMTQSNGCPVVESSLPELNKVRAAYADQGVQFFLVNSNLEDDRASIAAEAKKLELDIPLLHDAYQFVGESLKTSRSGEVYVIDPKSKTVVYHGPVKAKGDHLADALAEVVNGKKVSLAAVQAPGCAVDFPEVAKRNLHANISYPDTIAPILEEKCVDCHQQGGIGPWAMSSYEMIKGFSPMIREVIRTDRMPPWHADAEVGHFIRDRSLTAEEAKTLVHWIEAGSPRGEGADPLAAPRPALEDWPLGKPDMIVKLPAFTVPASGVVDYQYPVVANPMTEPRWLKATTVKVGSRETVHHVLSGFMEEMPKEGDAASNQVSWSSSVGGYAVGAESVIARENMGTYMPVGGAIGFQMHYTTYGKEVTDETEIGLYFYEKGEEPDLMVRNVNLADFTIEIPPNTAMHKEQAYIEFAHDAELLFAFPHAHYRGQASSLTVRYPDGKEELVLSLPRYDFNWQRSYEFAEPIQLPAGSKVISVNYYDNTERNPANPDPSSTITWGEQSHEEMLFTAISYRWKDETTANQRDDYEREMRSSVLFGMLDDNVNNELEKSELRGRVGEMLGNSFDRLDLNADGTLNPKEFAAVMAFMAQL